MLRKTKIVTTLGPMTSSPENLRKLLQAGANVVRLNFSHGHVDDHLERARNVRSIAQELGYNIAIMGDLQGPKIRISRFKDGMVKLEEGKSFVLDADLDNDSGDETQVGIDYKELPKDCKPGDVLLIDDGRIEVEVKAIDGNKINTTVLVGGEVSNNKGINRKGGGLSAQALTQKDLNDIKSAAQIDVDYLAISFPRHADDIVKARELLKVAGSHAGIIAKIERAEAVANEKILDGIIKASDGVMIARGDLGVEIGDAELIGVQKRVIKRARQFNKLVITATQMMESMIDSPLPTRAEVFDVANAVLDGTDAVMLSAETATGKYPDLVVAAMSRACVGAEKYLSRQAPDYDFNTEVTTVDEAVARATMLTAQKLAGVKAILCLTESGSTPLWMSRIRTNLPIFALTRHQKTQGKVTLYRGVDSIPFDVTGMDRNEVNKRAVEELRKRKIVKDGELVLLTKGDHMGIPGGTNAMKILVAGLVY